MAKQYAFRMLAVPAEFKSGMVHVLIARAPIACEDFSGSLRDAEQALRDFSAKHDAPHVARLTSLDVRKPPGFDNSARRVEKP